MYAVPNPLLHDFIQDSRRSTNALVNGRRFYFQIKNSFFAIFATIFSTLFLIVAIPFGWLFVFFHRKKLEKNLMKNIELTNENYAHARLAYEDLLKIKNDLDLFDSYNIQQFPFFLRGILKEIQRFGMTILKGIQLLDNAFEQLEKDTPPVSAPIFEQISSKTLWENRPKHYEYFL